MKFQRPRASSLVFRDVDHAMHHKPSAEKRSEYTQALERLQRPSSSR